jgi:hypothetical protein
MTRTSVGRDGEEPIVGNRVGNPPSTDRKGVRARTGCGVGLLEEFRTRATEAEADFAGLVWRQLRNDICPAEYQQSAEELCVKVVAFLLGTLLGRGG